MTHNVFQNESFGSTEKYHYTTADYVGKGSYGTVYKATVRNLWPFRKDRVFAVKVVHLDNSTNWAKWRNVLEVLLQFKHPNLVQYHKVTVTAATGHTGAFVELMMDYYKGDLASLLMVLKEDGRLLDQRTAIRYSADIAQGLKFLHAKNIIHGDLKPRNVLVRDLDNFQKALLICDLDDFVQMQRSSTASDITHLRGTYRYMSPEMLRFPLGSGDKPGRKTDIWSLGCVMLDLTARMVDNDEEWFHKGTELVGGAGNRRGEMPCTSWIMDGYVPLVPSLVPTQLANCIRDSLCTAAENRISADKLTLDLKSVEQSSPKEVLVLYSRHDTNIIWKWFDPGTRLMRSFAIPEEVADLQLQLEFIASDGGVISRVKTNKFKDPVLNAATQCNITIWNSLLLLYSLKEKAFWLWPIPLQNKLYFFIVNAGDKQGDVQASFNVADIEFNDNTDVWSATVSCLRTVKTANQYRLNATRCGSKIIVLGGNAETGGMAMECFDPSAGNWKVLQDFPEERLQYTLDVLQGSLYLTGGFIHFTSGSATKSCFRYNISKQTWEKICDLTQPRANHCAFVLNDRIYVYGGFGQRSGILHSTMEVYDADRNVWSDVTNSIVFQCDAVLPCYGTACLFANWPVFESG